MIKIKINHLVLYAIGIGLIIFGQRSFWEDMLTAQKQKDKAKRMRREADEASRKSFEIQELQYDSVGGRWTNNAYYFRTIHVGDVNFKALKKKVTTNVETHDEENASDSN